MDVVIVIPARYGSRRFPGKPMALIRDRSLLERTWRIARAVQHVTSVHVATEDERVAAHACSFGANTILTSPDCRNGTERVQEAVGKLLSRPDVVINFQGDAVLTPPWVLQALVDAFLADPAIPLATLAMRCTWKQLGEIETIKRQSPTSGTLVTLDKRGYALYFSKAIIPYLRIRDTDPPPVYRHIGIYGYRTETLATFCDLEETPLEHAEQLEQLRALENGIPIKVVLVDYRGRTHWSIDAPEDVIKAEEIIGREGELLVLD